MSTFLDKFFSRPFLMPEWNRDLPDLASGVQEAMKKAECVVANNVSDYYFAADQEDWDFPQDFPMIVPPFRTCLVEMGRPPKIFSKTNGDTTALLAPKYPKSWAVLFEVNKIGEVLGKDAPMKDKIGWRGIYLRELFEKFSRNVEMEDGSLPPGTLDLSDPTKRVKIQVMLQDGTPLEKEMSEKRMFDLHNCWFLTASLFIEPCGIVPGWDKYGDSTLGPMGLWSCLVDKYGYVMNEPLFSVPISRQWAIRQVRIQKIDAEVLSRKMVEDHRSIFSAGFFWPAFLAVSFMHCKNVVTVSNDPPPKLNKRRAERGHRPLIRYKTLVIEPMKKVLRHEGHAESTGIKQAMHICRGHFKDYRGSEKGLFGKYKGLWFWEAHLAGEDAKGTIVKDYEEHAPKEKP